MNATVQTTFFPIPEQDDVFAALKTPWERYRHFMEVSEAQGGLIPQNILKDVLGLSNQRVYQLIAEGRFVTFTLFGQKFVTAESFGDFVQEERKIGRPFKEPSTLALAKASYRGAKEMLGNKK